MNDPYGPTRPILDLEHAPPALLDGADVVILWTHSEEPEKAMRVIQQYRPHYYAIEGRYISFRTGEPHWASRDLRTYMTLRGLAVAIQVAADRLYGLTRAAECVRELTEAFGDRPQMMMPRSQRKWRPVTAPPKPVNEAAYQQYPPLR